MTAKNYLIILWLMKMQFKTTNNRFKTKLLQQMIVIKLKERVLRNRSIGIVRFIGELYCQNMLITNIIECCIIALLKIRTDEKLEYLCELLTMVGKKMEEKADGKEPNQKYYCNLTPHFKTIHSILSVNKKFRGVSPEVRSKLLELIKLRNRNWGSPNHKVKTSKTQGYSKQMSKDVKK